VHLINFIIISEAASVECLLFWNSMKCLLETTSEEDQKKLPPSERHTPRAIGIYGFFMFCGEIRESIFAFRCHRLLFDNHKRAASNSHNFSFLRIDETKLRGLKVNSATCRMLGRQTNRISPRRLPVVHVNGTTREIQVS